MRIVIRRYEKNDLFPVMAMWNKIIEDGEAFPQTEPLTQEEAERFFGEQNDTTVAEKDSEVVGFYILHPNNVGRCGHIGNASYGVRDELRGEGIGRLLVEDSLARAKELGYGVMQFNAVVDCNFGARKLYKELGFVELGTIPAGFNYKDDHYEDIHLMYHLL